ncbi:hypothetical protein GCM10027167_52570 [Nocardia heshunensis]
MIYRFRYAVIAIVVGGLLTLGAYGLGLGDHLSTGGLDDPTSQSARAAQLKDATYGRDHISDVLVLYTAPDGGSIDDPVFSRRIVDNLNSLPRNHPDQIAKINLAYWKTDTGEFAPALGTSDKRHAFASVAIKGDDDTVTMRNFREVRSAFDIDGVTVQVAGLQPIAGTLFDTMAQDQRRMEMLALPAVAVLLFVIFGGLVAASLPLIVGGLTIVGATGIVMVITHFTEVNSFVSAVVSMIGFGLAIDYGLFIVSRFREELAEGYETRTAVRRTVRTAGRTVASSATMIIAASSGMLLFPQGFLKSVAYGTMAAVLLAAATAVTLLPALLSVLGPRVDSLGWKRLRKTRTAEEVERGFWGRLTEWVMRNPVKVMLPLTILLLLLIIPVKNLAFGGLNETYLPPADPTRVAQADFDRLFPIRSADPIELVIVTDDPRTVGPIITQADKAPGLAPRAGFDVKRTPPQGSNVWATSAALADSDHAGPTIDYLRSMDVPDGTTVLVGGRPAIQQDSVDSLLARLPLMIGLVVLVTMVLMFLTFGSLVLPIKAALMSALGLGSTLGILTWIFIDGHGASLLDFTAQPITSPVLVLIIAIIYGLSIDYEVFLLSRMVEARARGASTTEAVRIGTAQTGRIITAAALILLVVTGAFAFSHLVMMKYIAFGLVSALFIDATVLRMLLVPATMKLLGDDCWWAPAWLKKLQHRIGLAEPILDDERPGDGDMTDLVETTPVTDPVTEQIALLPDGRPATRPRSARRVRPRRSNSDAPTLRLGDAAKEVAGKDG